MKEKDGFFITFVCVDVERRGYVDLEQWMKLISTVFGGINNKHKTKKIFETVDSKNIGYLDPEQFFDCCDLIFWMKELTTTSFSFKLWVRTEYFI